MQLEEALASLTSTPSGGPAASAAAVSRMAAAAAAPPTAATGRAEHKAAPAAGKDAKTTARPCWFFDVRLSAHVV